jgi:hypothetical protein
MQNLPNPKRMNFQLQVTFPQIYEFWLDRNWPKLSRHALMLKTRDMTKLCNPCGHILKWIINFFPDISSPTKFTSSRLLNYSISNPVEIHLHEKLCLFNLSKYNLRDGATDMQLPSGQHNPLGYETMSIFFYELIKLPQSSFTWLGV